MNLIRDLFLLPILKQIPGSSFFFVRGFSEAVEPRDVSVVHATVMESAEGHQSFWQGVDSDDDFEHPFLPVPSKVVSFGDNTRVRKDVMNPGTKPRLGLKNALHYKYTMTGHGWMSSEDQCEKIENELAMSATKCKTWKPFKRPNGLTYKGKGALVKAVLECPFNLECGCPFKLRRVRRVTQDGHYEFCLEVGDQQHCDHNLRVDRLGEARQREHVSLAVKAKIDSPSKIENKPRNLVKNLSQGGFALTSKMQASVKVCQRRLKMFSNCSLVLARLLSLLSCSCTVPLLALHLSLPPSSSGRHHNFFDCVFCLSRQAQDANIPRLLRGTFDGLQHFFDQKERDRLVAAGTLHEHTSYTLCCEINAETKRVVCAFSSENLLLNAYRQSQLGMPSLLCMDASYRLVIEGHRAFLFGTTGVDHKFHIIFMGVCSSEDTAAHRSMYDASVREVERIVADRSERGIGI